MADPASPWQPDAFTLARGNALQHAITNQQGSVIAVDGETTQREVPPAVAAFAAWVRAWPGIRSAGTRRSPAKASTAGRRRDIHEEGRAVDAMIAAPNTPEGNAAGDALSAFLVENADRLGVQGVIWRRTEWFASRTGAAWEPYGGPDPHTSHPHIEFSPEVLSWSAEEMRRRLADVVANPARAAQGQGISAGATMAWVGLGAALAYAVVRWRAGRR